MSRQVILPPDDSPVSDGIRTGGWWHQSADGRKVVCDLCPRGCALGPGDRGFCFVRQNREGRMVSTTYGRSTGFCIDPIEKKPLHQFYPGTSVLSFGTAGCNLGCKFCQNWTMSKSREVEIASDAALPEDIARTARAMQCQSVAFTYNDPVVWAEYAMDTAKACRERGVKTVAVTAGYITPLAREPFYALMDAANVDLKGFTEEFYWKLSSSHLDPVLDTLRWIARESSVWLEITNLVIPQANDAPDEISRMCDWLVENVGEEVPLHFSAFHPDFRMTDRGPTPPATLAAAWEIARRAGLKYVYTGNIQDERHQSTYCPACGRVVIQRDGYELGAYDLKGDACRHCGTRIAGRFGDAPGQWGARRMPVRITPKSPSRLRFNDQRQLPMAPKSKGSPPMATETSQTSTESVPASVRPNLTDSEEDLVLRTAAERVVCAVRSQPPERLDQVLGEVACLPVLGAFVSLKRSGQLRSCCGFLGSKVPLHEALDHAAVRAAKDDPRFPPISPAELPYLDLEVWILWNMQPVAAKGKDRIKAVTIGTHGLQISRGSNRGLLLPGVPVEHQWDAETFLRQVCVKAGLPPEAWKDHDTVLSTFEGYSIGGKMSSVLAGSGEPVLSGGPTLADVAQLADFCRDNVIAHFYGATASCYAPAVYDGGVNGVVLSVRLPGRSETLDWSVVTIRPEMPLQSTLFNLTKLAGDRLAQSRVDPRAVEGAICGLSVFWDPAMHGPLESPDMAGIDPRRRAVVVMDQSRWVLAYDPAQSPQDLLARCMERLGLSKESRGLVCSLAAVSTQPPVLAGNAPAPQPIGSVRPPAVAGRFYPGTPETLDQMIEQFLPRERKTGHWASVLVPHAGWMYSGRLAAEALSRVEIPSRVIVICPKHRPGGSDWAVAPCRSWALPGREVESDLDLARQLAEQVPGLALDSEAHREEHAIEVQLPLLARLAPKTRVVGIAIHGGDFPRLAQAAEQLACVLRGLDDRPLLIISSDMNHYADDDRTRRLDRMALDAIEALDPQGLYETVTANRISMCGMLPAVLVMETLRQLGSLNRYEAVAYATSGDVSGDRRQVVGYATGLFA